MGTPIPTQSASPWTAHSASRLPRNKQNSQLRPATSAKPAAPTTPSISKKLGFDSGDDLATSPVTTVKRTSSLVLLNRKKQVGLNREYLYTALTPSFMSMLCWCKSQKNGTEKRIQIQELGSFAPDQTNLFVLRALIQLW